MKKYLIEFECRIGDYEHFSYYVSNKKKSKWGYCKEFWGINKRDSNCLKEGAFWNDQMDSAISVYSETEITNQEADVLQRLGVA
tara:strand:+ start:267 stop:518 length:252 start_codon:yes stop_codon:yes gene_type:complete